MTPSSGTTGHGTGGWSGGPVEVRADSHRAVTGGAVPPTAKLPWCEVLVLEVCASKCVAVDASLFDLCAIRLLLLLGYSCSVDSTWLALLVQLADFVYGIIESATVQPKAGCAA